MVAALLHNNYESNGTQRFFNFYTGNLIQQETSYNIRQSGSQPTELFGIRKLTHPAEDRALKIGLTL
jgi:hypothetical protein